MVEEAKPIIKTEIKVSDNEDTNRDTTREYNGNRLQSRISLQQNKTE